MPYRSRLPIRTYALRSSRVSVVVAVGLGLLSLAVGLVFAYVAFETGGVGRLGWPALVLGLAFPLLTAAYAHGLRNDLVCGGKAELRLFERHLDVPRPFVGPPLTFPIAELRTTRVRVQSGVLGGPLGEVEVLHLQVGTMHRGLSSRLFETPHRLGALAEDLAALEAGLPLPTHDGRVDVADPEERADDPSAARLEAELDELE